MNLVKDTEESCLSRYLVEVLAEAEDNIQIPNGKRQNAAGRAEGLEM